MAELHPSYRPATLCEVCARALGHCPWSEPGNQSPVPGWDAIRNDIYADNGVPGVKRFAESYIVLQCPLFVLEEHNRWAFERFDPEKIKKRVQHPQGKRKKVRMINTGQVYESTKATAAATGLCATSIRMVCGKPGMRLKGTMWEYVEEEHREG